MRCPCGKCGIFANDNGRSVNQFGFDVANQIVNFVFSVVLALPVRIAVNLEDDVIAILGFIQILHGVQDSTPRPCF